MIDPLELKIIILAPGDAPLATRGSCLWHSGSNDLVIYQWQYPFKTKCHRHELFCCLGCNPRKRKANCIKCHRHDPCLDPTLTAGSNLHKLIVKSNHQINNAHHIPHRNALIIRYTLNEMFVFDDAAPAFECNDTHL